MGSVDVLAAVLATHTLGAFGWLFGRFREVGLPGPIMMLKKKKITEYVQGSCELVTADVFFSHVIVCFVSACTLEKEQVEGGLGS